MQYPIDYSSYIYPLLINGERYLFNKDPFLYAEEGVAKYWAKEVEELSLRLLGEEMDSGKRIPSTEQQLKFKAARALAPRFLGDDNFITYYIQDGGDLIKEIKEIKHGEIHTLFQSIDDNCFEYA